MKKTYYLLLTVLIAFTIGSCGDDSNPVKPPVVEEASAQKQFVWEGLNFWYYWQNDVPELRDNHFEDDQAYQNYLMGFADAEALFEELKYTEDRFSWFIEDYEKQEQAFKGISKSFGFSYGLVYISENSNKILGYVQYVVPNTPADKAGLQRGDIFVGINGTELNDQNYITLLNSDSYELAMAEIQGDQVVKTGETINMQAVEIHENPVFMATVIDTGSTKVGYLVLNAFRSNYHQALNDSVGTLLAQGIDELILDLRYNGGGAIVTCSVLASMISGNDSTDIFAKFNYSEKRSALNSEYSFFSKLPVDDQAGGDVAMNKLSLNRLYVLTGYGTASASEMIINGLKPYMEVILVGEQTVGKDVGSITVYDSPPYYNNKENLNPTHTIAMQPIVVKLVNADGQDYPNGFTPSPANIVEEVNFLENGLPPMGDTDDPLLARALQLITGGPVAKLKPATEFVGPLFRDSRDLKPFGKAMYLPPEMIDELNF